MFARIVIVEDDFNDLTLFKNERVGVRAVDGRVGGGVSAAERGVERLDIWLLVCNVVEESAGAGQERQEGVG